MSTPRIVRCGKCQVVMDVRHYVLVHRKPGGLECPPVPCSVCKEPVASHGRTAFGEAVCSEVCEKNHPGRLSLLKSFRDVSAQLKAIKRAQKLPLVYQRRRAS